MGNDAVTSLITPPLLSQPEPVNLRSSRPMFPDVGVIALVPDSWHWQWQPRHQVMTRLARFFPVVWMNPAEYWRKAFASGGQLREPDFSPIPDTDFVVHTSSRFLPLFYSPRAIASYTLSKRLQSGREILLRKGCKKIVLYLWRPEFALALDHVPHDLACYHIDDEYTFSSTDTPVTSEERQLITRANHVFIHSPALLEKKGALNPNTTFAPNGVDFDSFAKPVPEPEDLRAIPHPRVGYCGHLKKQLDWPLLTELAAQHPEWSFVFVGAANSHPEIVAFIERLSQFKNVKFLGSKTAQELANYPQHFDVCIMPYVQDDYTKYIYPLKLHEYLAGGRPVVGTPIPSLLPFRESIQLPQSTPAWSLAIAESLKPSANSSAARTARQAVAKAQDWKILVQGIAQEIASHLGPSYKALFEKLRNQSAGS
ncbi:MAG TPA: glycosyltransferase [Candidatus Acidoferrum sp.]|nr:glycosyltransferase [Candidatus Acidoferrum sp.]